VRPIAWLAVVSIATLAQTAVVGGAPTIETATLAGGCFWCLEADLARTRGVIDVETGYTGGDVPEPTFRAVVSEPTGHVLAVRVTFDPGQTSYEQLLVAYYLAIDPTDPGGQACERGPGYRPAVFYNDAGQRATAERIQARATAVLRSAIAVEQRPATRFWPAEEFNQDYAAKSPLRYDFYRRACGRDKRIREVWGPAAPLLASRDPRSDTGRIGR
jgi:peptide-methionine (S)-S-oxide reductase